MSTINYSNLRNLVIRVAIINDLMNSFTKIVTFYKNDLIHHDYIYCVQGSGHYLESFLVDM